MEYQQVQKIAKDTIEYAKQNIVAGINLLDIRKMCEDKMLELGADSFWYWDVGAFVFAGNETTISVSGTKYKTSDRMIEQNDIITIDLSPQIEEIWGDYARTIIIQNGVVVEKEYVNNAEWKSGLIMEDFLHKELLGHSIVKQKNDRIYIEKGNMSCLGEVSYFTFEPHISVKNSRYGYKKENIYYFKDGKLKEL